MTIHSSLQLEPCLARLGIMPEDDPSFIKEVNSIDDIEYLRKLLIEKERKKQSIANDLDVAAHLGLVISQTNEALQIKVAHLENENQQLQDALYLAQNSTGTYIHDDTYSVDEERHQLTEELNQARSDLNKFRIEMEQLSGQLNDMAAEMIDSRARVSLYAKKLAEVEHKLTTTREMNSNLQLLLDKALTSQKQSSSTTSHLVRNIQMDLSRVVTENDQLRNRIGELENQQRECEDRLSSMVDQAKEYASLLEQAQNTIHSLSEPRLDDDELLTNDLSSLSLSSSNWDGPKESEITKGPVFSVEFRQEMQKEIERNLNIRNEIRHRIITVDTTSASSEKKKTQEGLKSLLADREQGSAGGIGLLAASASTSTSNSTTTTSTATTFMSIKGKDDNNNSNSNDSVTGTSLPSSSSSLLSSSIPSSSNPINTLRPSNFLTGFNGFNNENSNLGLSGLNNNKHFLNRGRFMSNPSVIVHNPRYYYDNNNSEPSISTRFFQRIASRFEEKKHSV